MWTQRIRCYFMTNVQLEYVDGSRHEGRYLFCDICTTLLKRVIQFCSLFQEMEQGWYHHDCNRARSWCGLRTQLRALISPACRGNPWSKDFNSPPAQVRLTLCRGIGLWLVAVSLISELMGVKCEAGCSRSIPCTFRYTWSEVNLCTYHDLWHGTLWGLGPG